MTIERQNFYKRMAIYGATSAALGACSGLVAAIPQQIPAFALAYFGACCTVDALRGKETQRETRYAQEIAHDAPTIRPPVTTIGTIVSEAAIQMTAVDDTTRNAIQDVFDSTQYTRLINPAERALLGYTEHAHVFVTRHSAILIDATSTGEPHDVVLASAHGATLVNESGKPCPLLKPQALRMMDVLATIYPAFHERYPSHEDAEIAWDIEYDHARGHQRLDDAYQAHPRIAAVIMDGPKAMLDRGGVVLPYGDYRYIGLDRITGIDTIDAAQRLVTDIEIRGIYDADRQQYVHLPQWELSSLAQTIFHERNRFTTPEHALHEPHRHAAEMER